MTAKAKWAAGGIAALLLLAAAAYLLFLRPGAELGPPPRATDKIALKPQSSIIAVPIEADLAALDAALEREVPRTLWTVDMPDQVCAAPKKVKILIVKVKTPTIKCRIVGQVTRGSLTLSGSGRNFVVTMPINAVLHARDIGGIIKQETATASAQVRALIRLDLAEDWSPRSTVDISYDWTREPSVEILGKRIELTSKADAKLQGVVTRLERTVAREIAKLQFRQEVQSAWQQAFTSLQLNRSNPPVWMRITPQELQYGGYEVRGRKLVLNLGMKAITETFVGNRPADPAARPLPGVRPLAQDRGALLFYIPVIADYAQLEPVIQKALIKRSARPFEVPGIGPVMAEFGKITAYGTTGGRVAVGVTFGAARQGETGSKAHGTVWLTGLPINPANTRLVRFTDVQVYGTSDSTKTNLLLKLANAPSLSQTIAEALEQNFSKDYAELMGKISRAIDDKREGNLLIRARIDNVRTGSLVAAGEGLYLPVWGSGTASIQVVRR